MADSPPDSEIAESEIAIGDHPARRLVALAMIIGLGILAVVIFRPPGRGAEESITPYLGESVQIVIHTEPGAAPDDLQRFEAVSLVEIGDYAGERAVKVRFEEMTPVHDPGGNAEIWFPLDRIAAVWVGPLRVYWAPKD